MLTAITREVSPSINRCELTYHSKEPIDLVKAIAQHVAYEECLRRLGARVVSLAAEPDLPDAVFVEDAAIVVDEVAVIPVMGAASRRKETESLARALSAYRPLKFMDAPATLDGGDVMRIGRTLFIGVSARTNQAGIEQMASALRPYDYDVKPIEVRGCLHLKSACSYVGEDTILVNQSWIDAEALRAYDWVDVPDDEQAAANALLLRNAIILPASFPGTRALLERRGFRVMSIDMSELQKAEAGVTCTSLIFEDHGPQASLRPNLV